MKKWTDQEIELVTLPVLLQGECCPSSWVCNNGTGSVPLPPDFHQSQLPTASHDSGIGFHNSLRTLTADMLYCLPVFLRRLHGSICFPWPWKMSNASRYLIIKHYREMPSRTQTQPSVQQQLGPRQGEFHWHQARVFEAKTRIAMPGRARWQVQRT